MQIDSFLDGNTRIAQLTPFFLFVALSILMGLPVIMGGDRIRAEFFADTHRVGTVLMFILLPVYLAISMQQLARRTRIHLSALSQWVDQAQVRTLDTTIGQLSLPILPAIALGLMFGAYQNLSSVQSVISGKADAIDTAVTVGNCLLWAMVSLVIAWRVPQSLALYRLGQTAKYDVRFPDRMVPFSRIALMDILVVAGALVFLPLQSLDAEFRLHNYLPGLVVALSSACLMLSPLLGVRTVIIREREAELLKINNAIGDLQSHDIVENETLLSYRDRIQSLPGLPMNVAVVTRLIGYLFLAPMAWIISAYIESLF